MEKVNSSYRKAEDKTHLINKSLFYLISKKSASTGDICDFLGDYSKDNKNKYSYIVVGKKTKSKRSQVKAVVDIADEHLCNKRKITTTDPTYKYKVNYSKAIRKVIIRDYSIVSNKENIDQQIEELFKHY